MVEYFDVRVSKFEDNVTFRVKATNIVSMIYRLSPSPSPFLSLYRWMNPVIKEGNKRLLTDMDMPALARRDQARHLKELVQVQREARSQARGGWEVFRN